MTPQERGDLAKNIREREISEREQFDRLSDDGKVAKALQAATSTGGEFCSLGHGRPLSYLSTPGEAEAHAQALGKALDGLFYEGTKNNYRIERRTSNDAERRSAQTAAPPEGAPSMLLPGQVALEVHIEKPGNLDRDRCYERVSGRFPSTWMEQQEMHHAARQAAVARNGAL